MKYQLIVMVAALASLLANAPTSRSCGNAQPTKEIRKLLYPVESRNISPGLKLHVERMTGNTIQICPETIKASKVFIRVVPERHVLKDGKLLDGARLGTRPFVFMTCPETVYGRNLLQIFGAIGYSPRDILDNHQCEPHVAVVFTYADDVELHTARNGRLPANWQRRVYPTYWENLFSLAERIVSDRTLVEYHPEGNASSTKAVLRSQQERAFVIGFPDAGKKRIREKSYATLREVQGADWEYRLLLERLTGAAEHFKGDGATEVTLGRGEKQSPGFPEFLGPNTDLQRLQDLAIIRLGALKISD